MMYDSALPDDLESLSGDEDPAAVDAVLDKHLATALYLQVAGRERFHTLDLDARGATASEIAIGLRVLEARGLIARVNATTWETRPPDRALPARAAQLEEQAGTIRAAVPGLAKLYYDARARAQDNRQAQSGIEVLRDQQDLNAAMGELYAGADRQVVSMRTPTPAVLAVMNRPLDRVTTPLRNGRGGQLRVRMTFDTALLGSDAPTLEFVARRRKLGDEVRLASGVPFTASTADSGTTVLDVSSEDAQISGLRVTQPDLSAAIERLLEDTWRRATGWAGRGADLSTPPAPLDPRDLAVLRLLVAGSADATIARQLGISQRTVERRVSRMLERLGAATRFQAGVQAVRQGWL